MTSNKVGFVAAILCVLLIYQMTSSITTLNTSDASSIITSGHIEQYSSESSSSVESPTMMVDVPAPQTAGTVAIIVENAIYSGVSAAVNQYRQDLNDTGYYTILYTNSISTAEQLKALLSNWYTSDGLIGAVLIGRLPHADYHHPTANGFSAETFICDLFLTDLDGTWGDSNPTDGVYDSHSATAGTDIFPEIFIGRIDPTCLSWGSSVADNINTYLARVHNYRTGGVTRTRRALFYIDDDWIPWANSWSDAASSVYSTRTTVYTPGSTTTATDWVTNRVTQDYQWGHLAAHSSPTTHYFGPSGSGEGTVSSAQIHSAPPAFNFYNLFCCSGAEWTTTDNLAVTYTFSGSYSLAAIGSSKTGSMLSNDEFYVPLGQNETLGESLRDWFSQSLTTSSEAGTAYLEWFYGMNIVGDPLLTTYYDTTVLTPAISSPSHPDSAIWYNNPRPQVNWTVPPDVNQIAGYYYIIDHNPSTIPNATIGTYTTYNGTIPAEDLSSGTWYFHVVAVDSVGNVGKEAAHYLVHIDADPPEIILPEPVVDGTSITITWSVSDAISGLNFSRIYLDGEVNGTSLTANTTIEFTDLSYGEHVFNITAYDMAGNSITVGTAVTLVQPFPTILVIISVVAIVALVIVIVGISRRR